jgi:hypothetical protein
LDFLLSEGLIFVDLEVTVEVKLGEEASLTMLAGKSFLSLMNFNMLI